MAVLVLTCWQLGTVRGPDELLAVAALQLQLQRLVQ